MQEKFISFVELLINVKSFGRASEMKENFLIPIKKYGEFLSSSSKLILCYMVSLPCHTVINNQRQFF